MTANAKGIMTEQSCYYSLYGDLILCVPHYLNQATIELYDWGMAYGRLLQHEAKGEV